MAHMLATMFATPGVSKTLYLTLSKLSALDFNDILMGLNDTGKLKAEGLSFLRLKTYFVAAGKLKQNILV